MSGATAPFRLSTSMIFDCIVIMIMFGALYLVGNYIATSKASLVEQQQEYQDSDIKSLTGKTVSGADVANTIRKYKQDFNFNLETRSGNRVITVNDPFVNEADGVGYVPVDSWFDCEITQNLSGNITSVTFKERGEPLNVTDVTDTTEMKQLIVSIINNPNISMSSTWADIQEYLENNLIDDNTRSALLSAIPSSSEDDSWSELVDKIITTVGDLQSQQTVTGAGTQEVKKGTVSRNSYVDLPINPEVLLITTYGDEEYLFCAGDWYQVVNNSEQRVYVFNCWYAVQEVDVSDKFNLEGTRLFNLTSMAISYQYLVE